MAEATEIDSLTPSARLDRRGFVAALTPAGFALATQPICAQSRIITSAEGLQSGDSRIKVDHGELPVFYARPEKGENLPTVLVVQEIFGVHEYIRDICRRLAHMGYLAIAPELYFRQGNPAEMESIAEILQTIVARVPDAQVLADLDACAVWATRNGGDPERLAITGFCWGGRIAWLYAAHNPKLKAAIAWYGKISGLRNDMTPRHPIDVVDNLHAPVLGLYGGKDDGIPVKEVESMREKLMENSNGSEIIIYPQAPHAFHADYRPSYRRAEAEDGWKRLEAWLKNYL